jgi:hypothetical protein
MKDMFKDYPFYEHVVGRCRPVLEKRHGFKRIL